MGANSQASFTALIVMAISFSPAHVKSNLRTVSRFEYSKTSMIVLVFEHAHIYVYVHVNAHNHGNVILYTYVWVYVYVCVYVYVNELHVLNHLCLYLHCNSESRRVCIYRMDSNRQGRSFLF